MINPNIIFPFDEGMQAAKLKIPLHKNPYKAPNTPRTDSVRADAWLSGYKSIN